MYAFTYAGTLEIVVYLIMFIILYIPQWVMVRLSQYVKGRKIDTNIVVEDKKKMKRK